MNITLKIGGVDKSYTASFISARMLRRTIELSKQVNFSDISPEELDTLVNFVVEVYGKQFTVDDVYDGLSSSELMSVLTTCLNGVAGEVSGAASGKNA